MLKRFLSIVLISSLVFLTACSHQKKEEKLTSEADLYNAAEEQLEHEQWETAIKNLQKLEENFLKEPLSEKLCVIFEQETEGGLCEGHTEKYLKVRCKAAPGEEIYVLPKEIKDCIIYAERMK